VEAEGELHLKIFVARLADQVLDPALDDFLLLLRPLLERFAELLELLFQPLQPQLALLLADFELLGGDLVQLLASLILVLAAQPAHSHR
jgi:hypothetical protein